MKKVLYFCSSFPFPVDDGIKKINVNLLREMIKNKYNITLVTPIFEQSLTPKEFNHMDVVTFVKGRTFKKLWHNKKFFHPLYFSLYYDKKISKINKNNFDLIFYDFYPMTQYSSGIKNEIFMMPDSMKQLAYSNFINEKNIIRKIYSFVNYLLSASYNSKLNNIKKLYVSQEDIKKDNLKNSYYFKIPMDSMNMDNYQNNYFSKNELLFRGVMSFEPNITAVENFYSDIFLDLSEKYPNLTFKIIGKDPSDSLKKKLNKNTIFTGFVDDMMDVMSRSGIHIAPIYSGTGVKTKILDSIALKRLVMTTPKGIGGIFENVEEARDNGVIVFENKEEFFNYYDAIINNNIDYAQMTEKAYKFLNKETYSKKIDELFEIAKKEIVL